MICIDPTLYTAINGDRIYTIHAAGIGGYHVNRLHRLSCAKDESAHIGTYSTLDEAMQIATTDAKEDLCFRATEWCGEGCFIRLNISRESEGIVEWEVRVEVSTTEMVGLAGVMPSYEDARRHTKRLVYLVKAAEPLLYNILRGSTAQQPNEERSNE